jgi:glycine oxidase
VGTFDAAIIGGGIIGGSIAFELARHKLRVLLLDRQQPGQEASWAAAGMLSPGPDSPAAIPLVPLGRASLELYPEFVATVEEASGCTVGYRHKGTLEIFFGRDAERKLSTLIALHHGLGLPSEALRLEEARRLEPALSGEARAAVLLPYEASVDTRALTDAVLAAASVQGVTTRAGAAVTSLVVEAGRCLGVVAGGEKFLAKHVVLAAGCYSGEIEGLRNYAPTHPVRGQMVALRSSKARLNCVLRTERGYIVPRDDGRPQKLVVGSTLENAGFEKSVTPAGLEQILRATLELVPELADAALVETWSGLRPDTPDHLPVLGPTDIEGLVIATGHYRNGILLAPVTAKLIGEWLIEQRTSLPLEAFSPLRFPAAEKSSAAHSQSSQGAR